MVNTLTTDQPLNRTTPSIHCWPGFRCCSRSSIELIMLSFQRDTVCTFNTFMIIFTLQSGIPLILDFWDRCRLCWACHIFPMFPADSPTSTHTKSAGNGTLGVAHKTVTMAFAPAIIWLHFYKEQIPGQLWFFSWVVRWVRTGLFQPSFFSNLTYLHSNQTMVRFINKPLWMQRQFKGRQHLKTS